MYVITNCYILVSFYIIKNWSIIESVPIIYNDKIKNEIVDTDSLIDYNSKNSPNDECLNTMDKVQLYILYIFYIRYSYT